LSAAGDAHFPAGTKPTEDPKAPPRTTAAAPEVEAETVH